MLLAAANLNFILLESFGPENEVEQDFASMKHFVTSAKRIQTLFQVLVRLLG